MGAFEDLYNHFEKNIEGLKVRISQNEEASQLRKDRRAILHEMDSEIHSFEDSEDYGKYWSYPWNFSGR